MASWDCDIDFNSYELAVKPRHHKKKLGRERESEHRPALAGGAEFAPRFPYWLIPILVALVTFFALLPTLQNGFVNWDDDKSIIKNLHYRGLGWAQLRWMFTTFYMGHYQPLSWVSLGLDYLVWGMGPFGYHLTSLMLHAANAVLFYFLVLRLLSLAYSVPNGPGGGALRVASGFAALFFSIHPLRVESVAWVTERRDVLSGFFLLCAILCYLRAGEVGGERSWRRWVSGAVLFFGLSLLSKATGIGLPLVLLVLDVYPTRRLGGRVGWWTQAARRVWWEKAPFIVLALAAAVIASIAQYQVGAMRPLELYGIFSRLLQVLFGTAFYLWKTIVPVNLSPLYEIPVHINPLAVPFLLSGAAVIALTVIFLLLRRLWPAGLAVWVCYGVFLAPVLGVAQSGPQFVADRYSYLSCLGWAVLVGAGIFYLWCWSAGGRISHQLLAGAAVLCFGVLSGLGILARGQTEIWHDSEKLWRYALSIDEGSSYGHNNLGNSLSIQGKVDEAIAHFRRGLQIDPDSADLWYNLGNALARQGKSQEAEICLLRALDLNFQYADAHYDLGNLLASGGKLEDAAAHFREALRMDPAYAQAHNNLGSVLAAQGKLDDAVVHFREAVRIDPNHANAHQNLGRVLIRQGRLNDAEEQFQQALKIKPDYVEAYDSLGKIMAEKGDLDRAIDLFRQAVTIQPGFVEAHESLARALAEKGRRAEAIQEYQEALRILKLQPAGKPSS